MNTNIYTKNGEMSAYGFSCGYVVSVLNAYGQWKEMYREGGVYHVRWNTLSQDEIAAAKEIQWNESLNKGWKQFEKLSDAKKLFVQVVLDDKDGLTGNT